MKKSITEITVRDIKKCPVWRFTNDSATNDLEVESIANEAFSNLSGLVIGAKVTFSDGSQHWALLQNVSLAGQKVNDHFLMITIHHDGEWFSLARYHDVNVKKQGPEGLAAFIGMPIANIFPIEYDLRDALKSDSLSLVGVIREEPPSRFSQSELISLALL